MCMRYKRTTCRQSRQADIWINAHNPGGHWHRIANAYIRMSSFALLSACLCSRLEPRTDTSAWHAHISKRYHAVPRMIQSHTHMHMLPASALPADSPHPPNLPHVAGLCSGWPGVVVPRWHHAPREEVPIAGRVHARVRVRPAWQRLGRVCQQREAAHRRLCAGARWRRYITWLRVTGSGFGM